MSHTLAMPITHAILVSIDKRWLIVSMSLGLLGLVACDARGPAKPQATKESQPIDETASQISKENRPVDVEAITPAPIIPPELLDDEHVREEYGINEFTTPSIRRLFEDLDTLGDIPFHKLRPIIPENLSSERSLLALSLGVLIADGFLAVQAEDIEEIENIGRSILNTAKALGSGRRISQHGKALLENSLLGNWDNLKDELAATQQDVELEMLLLRDHEIAHLVSLGGWIRALEIAATTALDTGKSQASVLMNKPEVVDYFAAGLSTLHPRILKKQHIVKLKKEMTELQKLLSTDSLNLEGTAPAKNLMSLMPQIEQQAQQMLKVIRGVSGA